jgi:2-keto-4-pentenoate hydratase/2-oxohepta-3-ene-1,7-dioic acid hydratase in catechol pathway
MRLGTITLPDAANRRAAALIAGDCVLDLATAGELLAAAGHPIDREALPLLKGGVTSGAWYAPEGLALARTIAAGESRIIEPATHPLSAVAVGPPVPAPRTFLATGRNYMDHVREGQRIWAARGKKVETAAFPTAFVKLATSIITDGEAIVLPPGVENVDYEIELAVVIGKPAFRVPIEQALDHVAGYTICNDLGARKIQHAEMEHQIGIVLSKNFPTFAPLGPWLVTADEVGDPQSLDLRLTVNGETRQQASTSDMIFPVARLVSYWSQVGLAPGDIISTGTPAGVAVGRPDPGPFYLRDGDVVAAEISRVGTLRNPVRRAPE